jgi:hypothetical protein
MQQRTTSVGVKETMGETAWMHPCHTISYEVEIPKGGIRRRKMAGIRSGNLERAHVKGALSDKAIDKYVREGFYEMRHRFRAEKNAINAVKRLIYDPDKQDFILA